MGKRREEGRDELRGGWDKGSRRGYSIPFRCSGGPGVKGEREGSGGWIEEKKKEDGGTMARDGRREKRK